MKTKIYILTYKGFNRLNKTLKSVFESDYADNECEINIINNHSEIRIDEQYIKRVNILNNNLQADFSTGHMSRNWNQALILGFENLNNPKSDLVITLQDDVILHNQWYDKLINLHNKYNFVQNGHGDAICSYTPEAVKKVGLWDERFLMGKQCADYFFRHLMYNWDYCTINDPIHQRIHNPIFNDDIKSSFEYLVVDNFMGDHWPDPTFDLEIANKVIDYKYGSESVIAPWTVQVKNNAKIFKFNKTNFITYSYFEKDIYNLEQKGYVL